ncbi:MAG: hypothetical protein AB1483_07860 [Candidatus Zixiibacteriota bacterium]
MKQLCQTALFVLCFLVSSGAGRDVINKQFLTATKSTTSLTASGLYVQYAVHDIGNLQLVVANNGTISTLGGDILDPITGQWFLGCVYPKYSDLIYMFSASLWIGAVIGRDTAVSVASDDFYSRNEFWPTEEWVVHTRQTAGFEYKTIDVSSSYYSIDAKSEEDIICEYDDTRDDPTLVGIDFYDNSTHKPLNVEVVHRSMAWSYDYADDFILFDYKVKNVGDKTLQQVYMAIWMDCDILHILTDGGWWDDIVGFYRFHPAPEGCGFIDTINIAYFADNDGDPADGKWIETSPRAAAGVKIVKTPSDYPDYSFNWWITNYEDPSRDWGPRRSEKEIDPFRDFGDRLGTPLGDRNKYYVMRHPEFDYDMLYANIDYSSQGWLPPPEFSDNFADGFDNRFLLSFGPFDIYPGESLPITFALVAGDSFHVNPSDFETSWNPNNPAAYYKSLNFSNLVKNTRWASWIYDNPGIDTDGDGYFGKSRTCCLDTIVTDTGLAYVNCRTTFYEGDGVPDFRGASPPPAPIVRLEPQLNSVTVRFNGLLSETTGDQFTGRIDFEGYRVYCARDSRATSYSLVGSYDLEDYTKFVYNLVGDRWEVKDTPFLLEDLQLLYGDLIGDDNFNPLAYTSAHPYKHPLCPDSLFYFITQDYNCSELGISTPIIKRYPDQPYPTSLAPELARPDEVTEDGYLKYFEYEVTVDNLLPTVPYFINVTAFDFGSPEVGLGPMESSLLNGAIEVYPLTSAEQADQQNRKIYVYPNPYRADAGYDDEGYENRYSNEASSRMKRIHFGNLPPVCKIYIYSLDGDLVRELDHNYPDGGPEAMHDTWNLITRNTQAAVTGLYYWVVESEKGTQIGKFVIIK